MTALPWIRHLLTTNTDDGPPAREPHRPPPHTDRQHAGPIPPACQPGLTSGPSDPGHSALTQACTPQDVAPPPSPTPAELQAARLRHVTRGIEDLYAELGDTLTRTLARINDLARQLTQPEEPAE